MVGSVSTAVPFAVQIPGAGLGGASGGRETRSPTGPGPRAPNGQPLTDEQQRAVRDLKARDREVRAHEQAHMAAGGPYVSGPYYDYQKGPDGQRYAVGGSVNIDASPIPDDPAATVRKMDVVIRAALAPAEPSGQDLQVAASARQQKLQAQAQAASERTQALVGQTNGGTAEPAAPSPVGTLAGRRGSLVDISA